MLFLLSGDEMGMDYVLGRYGWGEGRSGLCGIAEAGKPCGVYVGPLVGGPRPSAFRAGFAVKFTGDPVSSGSGFFQVHVYSGGLLRLCVVPGGYAEIRFNKDVLQRSEKAFSAGRWYYVEVYVRPGPSGSFVVMVDGEEWVSFQGAVSFLPPTPVNSALVVAFPSPVDGPVLVDDFYLDTDPDTGDWLGDITVTRLPVESVAGNTGWGVDAAAGALSGGDPGDVVELVFGPTPPGDVCAAEVVGDAATTSPGPVSLVVSGPGGSVTREVTSKPEGFVVSARGGLSGPQLTGTFAAIERV